MNTKQYNHEYYLRNKGKITEKRKDSCYWEKNKKRFSAQRKKHYYENLEDCRARAREACAKYRRNHPDRLKEMYSLKKTNKDYVEKKRRASRKRYLSIKMTLLKKLGSRCVHCGFDDPRALQIDHVNGGGTREILTFNNREKYMKNVIEDKGGRYQILCANCNWIKRFEKAKDD